jgi:hypothetical protein
MKAQYEIEQHSEEWHKIRYAKIGGTLSKGLFVKSDTLLEDILSELCEEFDLQDSYQNAEMVRGSEMEPEARRALSQYVGVPLLECGWLQSIEIPLIGISPDGISECETITAEIKCPGAKKHLSTIRSNDIPNDNINQCLHYFTVNPKLEKHYFCSYRPENKYKPIFVKELTRESEINLGTKARPVIKTVQEWVDGAKKEAIELQKQINVELDKLKF